MSHRMRCSCFVFLLAVALPLAFAGSAGAASAVDKAYTEAATALARRGRVFHAVISVTATPGGTSTIEEWLDAAHGRLREEQSDGDGGKVLRIVDGENLYLQGEPTSLPARTCHHLNAAIAEVLACPQPLEKSTTTVSRTTHGGDPVDAITTTGTRSSEDASYTFVGHLFLDAKTHLPVARDEVDTLGPGRQQRFAGTFAAELVKASTLPTDLFDHSSIASDATDSASALAALPPGAVVYWLGTTFDPGAPLPASKFLRAEGGGGPGYTAILYYTLSSGGKGLPDVSIQVWPRDRWEDPRAAGIRDSLASTPCTDQSPLTLGNGGSSTFSCRGGDRTAIAVYPDTVLVIGFAFSSNDGLTAAPYATPEASAKVLQDLTRVTT